MSIEEDMRKYEEKLFGKTVEQIPDYEIKQFKEDVKKIMQDYREKDRIICALTYKHSLTSVVV